MNTNKIISHKKTSITYILKPLSFIQQKISKSKNQKFDYIYSIGERCGCATALNYANVRNYSGPFDWSWGLDLKQLPDIFESNFQDFFKKEDCSFNPKTNNLYNHHTGIVYPHEFKNQQEYETNFSDIQKKYQRRIERLLHFIHSGKKILFIYSQIPEIKNFKSNGPKNIMDIKPYIQKIRSKYPNIHFLFITHNEKLQENKFQYIHKSDGFDVVECFNYKRYKISHDGNNVNPKIIKKILKNYPIKNHLQILLHRKKLYLQKKIIQLFYHNRPDKGYCRVLCFKIKTTISNIEQG